MMKLLRIICSGLLLLSVSSIGKTQNYIPFPDTNAVWVEGSTIYYGYAGHPLAICDGPLYFGQDTIINTVQYHTLWGQEICKWNDMPVTPPPPGTITTGTDYFSNQLRILFRQDSLQKKVWIYHNNQEHLLYDFSNLVVGQPYPSTFNNPHANLNVMAYDSVLYNGVYHERWILGTSSQDSGAVAVIEGIGSTQGFAKEFLLPFESMNYLFCFSKDGVEYFSDWSAATGLIVPASYGICDMNVSVSESSLTPSFELFPNPAGGRVRVTSREPIHSIELLDLRGARLSFMQLHSTDGTDLDLTGLDSGMYMVRIQSGNSFAVRMLVVNRND